MDIDSMSFSDELRELLETFSREFLMRSVAITGGEPLLYRDLLTFTEKLRACQGIEKFSLTTNGTIVKDDGFWSRLKENGLYKANISVPDIINVGSACTWKESDVALPQNVFKNQHRMIKILNSIGVRVKINVAVFNDDLYTMSVLEQLLSIDGLKFDIVLLPNITDKASFSYSQKTIESIIKKLNLGFVNVRERAYTSDAIMNYKDGSGRTVSVKTTKYNNTVRKLRTMCSGCSLGDACQEGFYGLRVEQARGILFVRLCIHKNAKETLVPFKEFVNSLTFQELKENWGRKA